MDSLLDNGDLEEYPFFRDLSSPPTPHPQTPVRLPSMIVPGDYALPKSSLSRGHPSEQELGHGFTLPPLKTVLGAMVQENETQQSQQRSHQNKMPPQSQPQHLLRQIPRQNDSGFDSAPISSQLAEWRQQRPIMAWGLESDLAQTAYMDQGQDQNQVPQTQSYDRSNGATFGGEQHTYLLQTRNLNPNDDPPGLSAKVTFNQPGAGFFNKSYPSQHEVPNPYTFSIAKPRQNNDDLKAGLTYLLPFVTPPQKNEKDLGELYPDQDNLSMRKPRKRRLSSVSNLEQTRSHEYSTFSDFLARGGSPTLISSSWLPVAMDEAPAITNVEAQPLNPREPLSTNEQAGISSADHTSFTKGTARFDAIPPTDSGYASHKPSHNAHLDHKEQEQVVMNEPSSIEPTYAATDYSDNASLETTKRETFVEKLAEQLVTDLNITSANARNALNLCDEIVEILAAFALKLGHEALVKELQQAMVFIHKYRR